MFILQPANVLPVDIDVSRNVKRNLESTVQEMEIKSKKQILTLTDDGSVELMEVPCWKEI